MSVHTGFKDDPEEIPGLAHYLEHMVFMQDNKKIVIFLKKKLNFEDEVNKANGVYNAATEMTLTTFYFEVPN
jgi:secreted Zn-dependent insulinase-like peptidase